MSARMNTKLVTGSAIGAAIAASICCIGPLLLALLGLGGGALLLKFEPYRPVFLFVTGLILGGAFYVAYRRPSAQLCAPGTACAMPASRHGQKLVLWIVTGIVLLLATFPYYAGYLF
ncbi:MAG: mercuric transporter MerT family protein [Thermoanaerobaculia bacterium]